MTENKLNIHIISAILFFIPFMIFVSCNANHETAGKDTLSDSLVVDSVKNEPEDTTIHFSSAQEALDWMRNSKDWGKYSSGILPQMASDQVDYVEKLVNSPFKAFLIVDKATMKVYLYDNFGREIKQYGMACSRNYGSKHKKGDNRTSEGFFSIEGIYNSTDWLFTDDNGYTSPAKGQFGPRFIRLEIPGTRAIGIHGTASPWSIGGRRSHGCIRLTNENILDLVERVEKGVPVIISPSARDMAVNESEGYYIPSIRPVLGIDRVSASNYVPKMSSNVENQEHPKDSVENGNETENVRISNEPLNTAPSGEKSDNTPEETSAENL